MQEKKHLHLRKIPVYHIIKVIFQLIFFITLPGLFINAFAGIKELYTGLINKTFQFNTSLPILIEGIAIIPVTILMGRFFCGWMCAFGSFGDFLYFISQKLFRIKFKIPEKADTMLKYIKFAVLAFFIIGVWTLDSTIFNSIKPLDVFGSLTSIKGFLSMHYVLPKMLIGCITLLFIIIGSLFVERFFCRYLCPMGAVFTLISPLRVFKISKKGENCSSCSLCTKTCKMGIPMYQYEKISSGECIQCCKCIPVCPRSNTYISVGKKNFSPILAGILAIASITALYFGGSLLQNSEKTETILENDTSNPVTPEADTFTESTPGDFEASTESTLSDFETSMDSAPSDFETSTNSAEPDSTLDNTTKEQSTGYTDGTYEGTESGFRGNPTTVKVTVTNGQISNVEVVSHGDDAPYFERAFNSIVSQVLETQSFQADAVSGATNSSNGIIEAIADALNKAQ